MNRHAKAPSSAPSPRQGSPLGAVVRGALALALALVAFLGIGAPAALAAAPTATIDPATGVTATGAEVSGEVSPEGAPTTWTFQYITAEAYDQNLENSAPGFQGAGNGPSGTTSTTAPVSGELTGLDPGTRYHLRLRVESTEGSGEAVAPTFKTPAAAPLLKAWAAGPVAATTANLNAQIDPRGSATVYWFEWGTADCATGPCASIPAEHDASAGAGQTYAYVSRHLSGLQPETTYHFRVVAHNDSGTTVGDDQTFTTAAPEAACANQGMPGTNFLPDCRGYEMVSPSEKNGQDVIPNSYKTFAAEEGEGVSYTALGGFADVEGSSLDTQYVARRAGAPGTNGWATHSVNPLGRAPTVIALFAVSWPGFDTFTPDLTAGIYHAWSTLDGAPNVAGVTNLYRLRDLEGDTPQMQLLSPSAQPLNPDPGSNPIEFNNAQNRFDAASRDLSHVIFQSPWNLIGDGSFAGYGESGNLYEYAEGAGLRNVGRIPAGGGTECDDSSPGSACEASSAQAGLSVSPGTGASAYATGMISADGSRILFKAPVGSSLGTIYMREGGERTYQLNASEKEPPDSPQPAQIWGMSEDGSRVFFTTSESLVEEDEDGGASDLYMYEVGKPAGSRLTLLSGDQTNSSAVSSVVGTSADGHYVYFVADGQFVPGESFSTQGLFLWHEGQISYIGAFEDANLANLNTLAAFPWELATHTKTSRVTPDGRYLLFMSSNDPGFAGRGGYTGYDHGSCGTQGCRELYLYSADSGRLTCVSCNPRGAADTEHPADALLDVNPGVSAAVNTQHLSHALSDDGRHVFFSTTEALLPEDTNGKSDAYEYDTATGALHLISTGTDKSDSYFMDASPDGRDAYFVTRQQLVGWDHDNSYDLYDARVGGGFPEPAPVPAPCGGESCKPAPRAAPAPAPSGSQAAAPGTPKAPRCRKGTRVVRRHGKTVCAKKHHRKHHHPKANANRRAGR